MYWSKIKFHLALEPPLKAGNWKSHCKGFLGLRRVVVPLLSAYPNTVCFWIQGHCFYSYFERFLVWLTIDWSSLQWWTVCVRYVLCFVAALLSFFPPEGRWSALRWDWPCEARNCQWVAGCPGTRIPTQFFLRSFCSSQDLPGGRGGRAMQISTPFLYRGLSNAPESGCWKEEQDGSGAEKIPSPCGSDGCSSGCRDHRRWVWDVGHEQVWIWGYTPALVFLSLKWKISVVLQVSPTHLI